MSEPPKSDRESSVSEVVYVLGTPGSKTVKIGRTIDLTKRLADIQRMSPVPLQALWSHPGGCELETNLHRQFSALRTHGEWFTFGGDPVGSVKWAIEDEPWLRKKVSLKKAPRIARTPTPSGRDSASSSRSFAMQMGRVWSGLNSAFCNLADFEDPVERYAAIQMVEEQLADEHLEIYSGIAKDLKEAGNTWDQVGELLGGINAEVARQLSLGQVPMETDPRPKLPHDWPRSVGFPG